MAATQAHGDSCHVGSFGTSLLKPLVDLLLEPSEEEQQRRLALRGVTDSSFAPALRRSSLLCRRGAKLYPRSSELAVSFNGGKDACVVLYLWLASIAAAAAHNASEEDTLPAKQTVIFFDSPNEFESVRSFVAWVVQQLGLQMMVVEAKSFRQGMADLVDGGLRAVVMGQRRADPWMDKIDVFSPSDDGWPAFMRINPIIDWSYSHIWAFLRCFGLPYCSLYDEGYTSLGSMESTQKNPALLRPDGSYGAAHTLLDGSLERTGRVQPHAVKAEVNGASASNHIAKSCSPLSKLILPCSPALRAFKSAAVSPSPRTAGIVVIGNEVLLGKVHDENAHYLSKQLHSCGVLVKSIEVIPDEVEAIARCVRRMASRCDFVFTSGGSGPTHDDVTMAGVAAAFDCHLIEDHRFYAMLVGHAQGSDREVSCRKMATVPEGATVEWPDDGNPWPLVVMRNVYMFAGMPSVFRTMFERASRDGRFTGSRHWVACSLWLDADEMEVADSLQRTVDAFLSVEIGSYPALHCDDAENSAARRERLSISFEAFDPTQLQAAEQHFLDSLPPGILVRRCPEV